MLEWLRGLPDDMTVKSVQRAMEHHAAKAAHNRNQQPEPTPKETPEAAPEPAKAHPKTPVPLSPKEERALQLGELPDNFVVTNADACILFGREAQTLAHWRTKRLPPPFIPGRPVRYTLGAIRKAIRDKENGTDLGIQAANLKNIRRLTTLDDTYPIFKYESGLQLGYEAAASYQEGNEEVTYQSVDILCLGEFKHMKLGQELLQSPLPAITTEVAKDFDTATWLFLELTNGKPLPTNAVIQALRHLRDSGNDLNQPNNLMQKTTAHMLADYGDKLSQEEVSTLMNTFLDHGLNIYAEDYEGKSALDLAPIGGYMEKWERSRNMADNLEASLAVKPEEPKTTRKKQGI